MLEIPKYNEIISQLLSLQNYQIDVVLEMIEAWDTIPFISRYRKEKTWNLDETQIRDIIDNNKRLTNLYEAKNQAINGINELWLMTDELLQNIINSLTLKEVEELYKPYKSKKKTKAMIALEKWFWVVAESLKKNTIQIPDELLSNYSKEEIIDGTIDIISREIQTNSDLRHLAIENFKKYWNLVSSKKTQKSLDKLNDKTKEEIHKFEIYFDFEVNLSRIKPYQILAINRWEKLEILNTKILNDDIIESKIKSKYKSYLKILSDFIPELQQAFLSWYEALFSSVSNEIISDLKEEAFLESIKVFQTNLKELLLTKPEYNKSILAIDPWFRSGCKICVIDNLWNPVKFDKIFLYDLPKRNTTIKNLISSYNPDVIIIWNGTGTIETQKLVWEIFDKEIYIVNESWASVYSVSKIAEEEFPGLDSLDRWTISLGRRYIDPLSELVKVPVWSIWVGMYQHDVSEKKLEEKLEDVVVDCVNEVGISVNSASIYLLNYISWIDKRQAKKIFTSRPYKSRKDLEKVLSPKAYEQSIWFLRIPDSKNKFDNTDIHPSQYELANYIIENNKTKLDDKMTSIYTDCTQYTVDFIIESYKNIWKEKRINSSHTKFEKIKNENIKVWDIIYWVVRNVLAFWAFIDIWLKNDWLVHISQISNTFISNPSDFLKVWEKVKVKITRIDEKTGKIQLTMKDI